MEISLDFKQGFVFKYALSLTCLAIAPHVLYRSVAFQSCWEAHCLQQNLGQVITCHFFTLFCSSIGKKIWGWERQHLCGTKVPMLSHSVVWFFTHAECLTLPEGCCRLVALCVQWQDSEPLRCSEISTYGKSQLNLMAISKFLPDALVVCTTS